MNTNVIEGIYDEKCILLGSGKMHTIRPFLIEVDSKSMFTFCMKYIYSTGKIVVQNDLQAYFAYLCVCGFVFVCAHLRVLKSPCMCFRRGPSPGECGGDGRWRGSGWGRGGVGGGEEKAALLPEGHGRPGAQGPVGRGHHCVRLLVLGWLHPVGQAHLQEVRCPFYPHLVRHHVELSVLSPVLHRTPVQEPRETVAQAEVQVRVEYPSVSGVDS